mmetsp:Transcript_5766/g.12599  ORF Transcript_5766/g.12599 Transcript_5766/m.12599 type:complete len:164 (+) Transcript_5766:111-602(+)
MLRSRLNEATVFTVRDIRKLSLLSYRRGAQLAVYSPKGFTQSTGRKKVCSPRRDLLSRHSPDAIHLAVDLAQIRQILYPVSSLAVTLLPRLFHPVSSSSMFIAAARSPLLRCSACVAAERANPIDMSSSSCADDDDDDDGGGGGGGGGVSEGGGCCENGGGGW